MTQQIPKDIAEDSLVPIIVGITGHRKVTGVNGDIMVTEDNINEDQKNEIKKVFKELDFKYPNTPIVMLSPLAEGADRLVANLALSTKRRKGASVSLICPLPMPRDEYEKDFQTPESKEEFGEMLERSSAWFELPLVSRSTIENIKNQDGIPRKKQYEEVGKYIAQHSHILIALWDGVDQPDKIGGTSQIVKMRHEGKLVPGRQLDEIDSVPIYHFLITVKEKKNGEEKIKICPRREIFPGMTLKPPADRAEEDEKIDIAEKDGEMDAAGKDEKTEVAKKDEEIETAKTDKKILEQRAESFIRVFKRMEMFNRDIKSMPDKRKTEIETNKAYVIPCEECADLTEMSSRVLHHYAVADTQAIRFQKKSDRTLLSLFIIVLFALSCFEIYAHLKMSYWFLTGYPLGLAFGLFIFLYATRYKKVQSKYLDYRALAEGLRVQFFWILSAHTEEVIEFYLRKQKSELDWIKYAIRSFNMPYSAKESKEKQEMKTLPLSSIRKRLRSVVLANWVADQAKYFTRKAADQEARLRRQHALGRGFFFSGVAISILLFFLQLYLEHSHLLEEASHYLIVTIGMALAITAAIGGYTEKMAISAQAKRYSWMSGIFSRANTDLDELLNKHKLKEARELISELGREALEENADWLIIRRERKIEVPTG